MKFKFECPYCGQRISATEADVSTIGVCPACQRDVEVPAPLTKPEPPPVPASTAPTSPPEPKRASTPPAKPVVVPVPMPKRVPPAFVEMELAELEQARPRVPVFAFLCCVLPIPTLIGLRLLRMLPQAGFGFLLSAAALVCLLGIILAHYEWGSSKGGAFARAVAVLGLLGGYLSALVATFLFASMATEGEVKVRPIAESPEVKAEPVNPAPPTPAASPATTAKETSSPAPAPASATLAAGEFPPEQMQFFEGKIRPILVDKCYKCHAIETGKSKGGLTLDTRDGLLKGGETGPGLKPGDPDGSILIKAVLYTDSDLQMPPKGEKLSDAEIADLVAWVKMGAPDSRKAAK